MSKAPHRPLDSFREYSPEQMSQRASELLGEARRRRSLREFSSRSIPQGVLEDCLLVAASAPNGANIQPWHFAVIRDPQRKRRIRLAAEEEERAFYSERASEEWLRALEPLGTDTEKPFLETAPALVAIFSQPTRPASQSTGTPAPNYYVKESVGIATGFLIHALHHCGLASLTHTPSPMAFLNNICQRPASEKPFLLLVVGYPAEDASVAVAAAQKKPLDEIASFL